MAEYARAAYEQRHAGICAAPPGEWRTRKVSQFVDGDDAARSLISCWANCGVAATRVTGNIRGQQSGEQLLLYFHRAARRAFAWRRNGIALRRGTQFRQGESVALGSRGDRRALL